MPYYHYRQNNSGGYFNGPLHVYIEAASSKKANTVFEQRVSPFDRDDDCECCGPRWSPAWSDDGVEAPDIEHVSLWSGDIHIYTKNGKLTTVKVNS